MTQEKVVPTHKCFEDKIAERNREGAQAQILSSHQGEPHPIKGVKFIFRFPWILGQKWRCHVCIRILSSTKKIEFFWLNEPLPPLIKVTISRIDILSWFVHKEVHFDPWDEINIGDTLLGRGFYNSKVKGLHMNIINACTHVLTHLGGNLSMTHSHYHVCPTSHCISRELPYTLIMW